MRALVWKGPSRMEMEERPRPTLAAGWVLLEVEDSGICGSEISAFLGHNELRKPPLVMGHEFSGVIVEVGPDVPSEWLGRLVAVNPILSCGRCRACLSGQRQLCTSRTIIGVDHPGSYAEFVAVPVSSCHRIKDPLIGALVEPLACGVRAATLAEIEAGDNVLVIGAGTIGLMTARLAVSKRGANVCVVVDTNPTRLKWASNWGATSVLNPSSEDVLEAIKGFTQGEGVDAAIDAVGFAQTRAQALAATRRGGRTVFLGLHENATSLPGNEVVRFEKKIIGSFSYSDVDFGRAAALAGAGFLETASGWLDIRGLETGQESFSEQTQSTAPYSKIILRSKARK